MSHGARQLDASAADAPIPATGRVPAAPAYGLPGQVPVKSLAV